MNPVAWLVEDCGAGVREEFRFRQVFLLASELPPPEAGQFTITPLVAAPPTQTVADLEALLWAHKQAIAQQVVEYTRGQQGSVEDTVNDAIPFIAALLAPVLSCCSTREGAPTYTELVRALRLAAEQLDADSQRFLAESQDGDAIRASDEAKAARAILHRLPQQQEGTDR